MHPTAVLLQNVAYSLEGCRERNEIFRRANPLHRSHALDGINQIICVRSECRVHFVRGEAFLLAQDEPRTLEQEFQYLLLDFRARLDVRRGRI